MSDVATTTSIDVNTSDLMFFDENCSEQIGCKLCKATQIKRQVQEKELIIFQKISYKQYTSNFSGKNS